MRILITITISLILCNGTIGFTQVSRDYRDKLEEYFNVNHLNKNFSGSIILAHNDSILFSKSYGMANYEWSIPQTLNTKIKIASVTKTFTSAAILILVKQGKLSLSQTIDLFLPDFPSADKITITHLLSHSAGIPNPDYSKLNFRHHLTTDEVFETIKIEPLLFEPGTKDSYSNGGYFLLAYIIEKVSGQKYEEFLKDNIFVKLGMISTGVYEDEPIIDNLSQLYSIGPNNTIVHTDWYSSEPSMGSGYLYSTANDLYKWCLAVRNKTLFDIYAQRYPFGWGRRKTQQRVSFITQSGYNNRHQCLLMIFENGYYFIFNSNIGNTFFNKVYDDVQSILFGGEYKKPQIKNYINLTEDVLKKYVGEYQLPNQPKIRIAFDRGSLYSQFDGSSFRNYLVPLNENSFEMREELSTVTFKSIGKKVMGLTITYGVELGEIWTKQN